MKTYISSDPPETLALRTARVKLYAALEERQGDNPYTVEDLELYRTVRLASGDGDAVTLLDDLLNVLYEYSYDAIRIERGRVKIGYMTPHGRFFEECGVWPALVSK